MTLLAVVVFALSFGAVMITQDGELVTPVGSGTMQIHGVEVEAFPLPAYASDFVDANYKSYLVEVTPGIKVHVLEVGSGYPVYVQHGAPTSGFLYRKVADALPQDEFRIIMPTMVGLGFSSKVPTDEHSLAQHSVWMNKVLEKLQIEELIFSGHDWGGPVGMGALVRSPELMQGAVILNTVLDAPREKRPFALPLQLAVTPVIGELMFESVASMFDQLPSFQADPGSMPDSVVDLYRKPVEESGNAKGPLAILRMSADEPEDPSAKEVRKMETYYESLDIPVEIVWGMNDPLLAARLPAMQNNFPQATVVETQAGHFLQEEAPEAIAASIQRVHRQIQQRK